MTKTSKGSARTAVAVVALASAPAIAATTDLSAASLIVAVTAFALWSGRRHVRLISTVGFAAVVFAHWLEWATGSVASHLAAAEALLAGAAVIACALLARQPTAEQESAGDAQARATEARRELAQSLRLARVASEAAGVGGWAYRMGDERVQWSDAVCRIHGVRPGFSPTFEEALAFYVPEDRERVRRTCETAIADGVQYDLEARITVADGREVWVRTIGQPVASDDGRVVEISGAFKDISERKEAVQRYLRSARRLEELADAMPLSVWTIGEGGDVSFVNKALRNSLPELHDVSQNWIQLVHPDDQQPARSAWSAAHAERRHFSMEVRLLTRHAGYRWHICSVSPVHGSDNMVEGWIGAAADVHDAKSLQLKAAHLENRLASTLQSIGDPFITLDDEWRFTFVNRRAAELLRRPATELLGRTLWSEFPEAVGSRFELEYRAAVASGAPMRFEQRFDPLGIVVEVTASPCVEGLAIHFRDVTQAREVDARLRLLDSAVARLNDMLVITEAEPLDEPGPRVVFVNDSFERSTGYARGEVMGRSPRILQGPKTSRRELDKVRAAVAQREPVRVELVNYKKSGEEFWVEMDIVPLKDASGKTTHMVAVERDITDRKLLGEHVQQAQRMESIGNLTGGIAHDFNNLLTVIQGNSDLLSESLSDPEQRAMAASILDASERGKVLTHHLVAFARKQPLEPRVIDVNQQIEAMVALLRRTLAGDITIRLELGAALRQARVDPVQLDSAILNLCLNSRDAMPAGGTITIETANVAVDPDSGSAHPGMTPGEYVCISVSDCGTGISPEVLSHVFEPFFTTKVQGKGTGLGLSTVYGFAKQSGGHVTIDSSVDEGTSVKLFLPSAPDGQMVEPVTEKEGQSAGGSETILLVEDDELVRQYVLGRLVEMGYRVLVANNSAGALATLRTGAHVDLLFTDVMMPGEMSGAALADAARRMRPGLKVLLTSGFSADEIGKGSVLDPSIQFLAKPYRRSELGAKIREALEA